MKKMQIEIVSLMRIGGLVGCIGMFSHAIAVNQEAATVPEEQPKQSEKMQQEMPGQIGSSNAISSGSSRSYHDSDVGKRSNRFNGPDVDQRSNRFNDDVEDVGVTGQSGTSR